MSIVNIYKVKNENHPDGVSNCPFVKTWEFFNSTD